MRPCAQRGGRSRGLRFGSTATTPSAATFLSDRLGSPRVKSAFRARTIRSGRDKMPYPKIELHVHLEATLRPELLLEIAHRNEYPLPVDTVEGVRGLYQYRDFDHFMEVWTLVTNALRRADDFRQLVVGYAGEASRHGAVYLEGIFSPIERTWRGVGWDEIFAGYCDGLQEAKERHGIEVRLTPDITRGAPLEDAMTAVDYAIRYQDRGIVGIGLGGEENLYPPEPFEPASGRPRRWTGVRTARRGGRRAAIHLGSSTCAPARPDPAR